MRTTAFRAMGTDIEIIVDESRVQTESMMTEALGLAQERMRSLEATLSRFREDSQVSLINSRPGAWTDVSSDTVQILLLAQDAFARTQGVFNPFLGQVIENFGYNVTFEKIGSQPTISFSVPFIAPVDSPLEVDEGELRARINVGYKIDLGGIAKGWIVEQTAAVLEENGIQNFICNAGGDLVCKGTNQGEPWVVGIANPADVQETVMNLDVSNLCVATSGTYRRKWSTKAGEMHHIMDPFLGRPVQTDIMSCSVIHPSLVESEILAKVALILGSTKGIPWLNNEAAKGWVIITNEGAVKYSCN